MALTWSTDVAAGAWLVERIVGFGTEVGSVVPHGFEAYARLPHKEGWEGSLPEGELVALDGVLTRHTGTPDQAWFAVWEGWGWLHGSPAVVRTTSDGRGEPVPGVAPPAVLQGPRLELPHRRYVLLRGVVADAPQVAHLLRGQSPNLWWPGDRAWCVATEIDLAWTYVGGTDAAVADVLATAALDAKSVGVTDDLTG